MPLPWQDGAKAVKEALHRYRNALMRAQRASEEAAKKRAAEQEATDELRDALEQIVGRIRGNDPNGNGT